MKRLLIACGFAVLLAGCETNRTGYAGGGAVVEQTTYGSDTGTLPPVVVVAPAPAGESYWYPLTRAYSPMPYAQDAFEGVGMTRIPGVDVGRVVYY